MDQSDFCTCVLLYFRPHETIARKIPGYLQGLLEMPWIVFPSPRRATNVGYRVWIRPESDAAFSELGKNSELELCALRHSYGASDYTNSLINNCSIGVEKLCLLCSVWSRVCNRKYFASQPCLKLLHVLCLLPINPASQPQFGQVHPS